MFFTSVHSPRSAQSAHSHMVKSLVLIRHPKKWLENVTANDETASSRTFSSIAIFFAEVLLLVVMLGMGEKRQKDYLPKNWMVGAKKKNAIDPERSHWVSRPIAARFGPTRPLVWKV